MSVKKNIVYPVLLECVSCTDDIFWKRVFNDLAYGITPYGTYLSKGSFCCSQKGKEFRYKIKRKDVNILYKEIHRILSKKVGISSEQDIIVKTKEYERIKDIIIDQHSSWETIKKKNLKNLYIENFIINMKRKYSLSLDEVNRMSSKIFTAITFKIIKGSDIVFKEGEIKSIRGLTFLKQKSDSDVFMFNYAKSIYEKGAILGFEPLLRKPMSDNWIKHTKSIARKKT